MITTEKTVYPHKMITQKMQEHISCLVDTGALLVKNARVKIHFNQDNRITDIKIDQDVYKRKKI